MYTLKSILSVLLLLLATAKYSAGFDSGKIPEMSVIKGKSFRHGDLEDTLLEIPLNVNFNVATNIKNKKEKSLELKAASAGSKLQEKANSGSSSDTKKNKMKSITETDTDTSAILDNLQQNTIGDIAKAQHDEISSSTTSIVNEYLLEKKSSSKTFDEHDIKHVYFGNWLRDFNQAIDVGALRLGVAEGLIRLLVWSSSSIEFGYSTHEFEVTKERLGVYRPEEHIDNPYGYANGTDARKYDSRLRGPVSDIELEIDQETGMKNYIANERGYWDTSSGYLRKLIRDCISMGREAQVDNDVQTKYEAFRLLGQTLHTLEDFSAHSNYVELVLHEMGYTEVFPHVGNNTKVNLNGEMKFPLVTGSFGSLDFIHSLIGATEDGNTQKVTVKNSKMADVHDHGFKLAEFQGKLNKSRSATSPNLEQLKNMLSMIPPATQENINYHVPDLLTSKNIQVGNSLNLELSPEASLQEKVDAYVRLSKVPSEEEVLNMPVDKIVKRIKPLFEFKDVVLRSVDKAVDINPPWGFKQFKANLSESLINFSLGMSQPYLTPVISSINKMLRSITSVLVNDQRQWAVWTDENCSNPTHSQLSKDHFGLYLNEPAGKVAVAIIKNVVPLIVEAWEDKSMDESTVADSIVSVLHHPALAKTDIQLEMRKPVETWFNNIGDKERILQFLSSCGVRYGYSNIDGPSLILGKNKPCPF